MFGPFSLQPERQLLLHGTKPVRIGGRALDILTVLVSRAGEVVRKRELMELVWRDLTVEECNLKVNIAALRKTLGDQPIEPRYIATIVGRGYRFVSPVHIRSVLR
ncbi:winged helix-turn-helix domain-containing protein [Novosphingobium kaempferiae]|uniref:winged helix-turn-helix domain-containing protein n=1 Tax=Novosphingobium kaempferiae TaxID=2896849 RepID=UPI001E29586F|nr:transcriptional regulator [Novosphingobium kaempferiae]